MNLYTCSMGNPNADRQLLLIHGWGMNCGIWRDVAPGLAKRLPGYKVTLVDLPGHGKSPMPAAPYNSESLSEQLRPLLLQHETIVAGWSMGGLAALELVQKSSRRVSKLLLLNATPCFVQKADWPDAVSPQVFQSFADSLVSDYRATLKRFLSIQALGSPTAREDVRRIRRQLEQQGEAQPEALKYGLDMLLHEDKREQLFRLQAVPVSLISGARDRLVPIASLQRLARWKNIDLHSIPDAGHAPFISHPREFVEQVTQVIL